MVDLLGEAPASPKIAYVIGNGPSLTPAVLDGLIGKNTFAVNRIHLIYDKTDWRPTYYVRTEPPNPEDYDSGEFFRECKLHIDAGEQCIFPNWERELGQHENVEYINTCHHVKYGVENAPSCWHLPMVCDFGTVVTAAMQIAVLKNYDKIVLVGCDLVGGHFTDDYGPSKIQTKLWAKAHEIARRCCPIPIEDIRNGKV